MTDNLQKTISIEIFGTLYKDIRFNRTGEFIDIQTLKSKLTEDRLESFKTLERDGLIATIFVDTIAHFNVMVPQLRLDLNCGLLDLEFDKMIELAYIFKDVYYPWYDQWIEKLSKPKNAAAEVNSKEIVSK